MSSSEMVAALAFDALGKFLPAEGALAICITPFSKMTPRINNHIIFKRTNKEKRNVVKYRLCLGPREHITHLSELTDIG